MLFATLPDERIAGRVLHPLPEVLLTALCAMISDCESYTDMESFARSQLDWLRQFIPLRHGPPSHDVFCNTSSPCSLSCCSKSWNCGSAG